MTCWNFFLLKNNLGSTSKLKIPECWKTDYVSLNKKHPTTGSALYQNFLKKCQALEPQEVFCQSVYSVKNTKLGFFLKLSSGKECDSPNNTEQTGTSHKSTSQSEISGFNVFSPPIQNINMLPGTSDALYQSSHCQYFKFQLNMELGIFIMEKQQVANSVSISLIKAESNYTAQVEYWLPSTLDKVCVTERHGLGISSSCFISFTFLPVGSVEHGLPSTSQTATSIWSLGTSMIEIFSFHNRL